MIALLRQLILCVTAASLFGAVALSLVQNGALKEAVRMGVGFVLILSLIQPLRQLLPMSLPDLLPKIDTAVQQQSAEDVYQQVVLQQVEVETEEYVVQEAAEMDISCEASVTASVDSEGQVSITAVSFTAEEGTDSSVLSALRKNLAAELGVSTDAILID